jgi:hypothetical protein
MAKGDYLSDPKLRAQLVEDLRLAENQLRPTAAPYRLRAALKRHAFALCDHARLNSDGTCRYCEGKP